MKKYSFVEKTVSGTIFVAAIYIFVAWMTFQYNNPKSNEMSFYRHFKEVVTFQVLDQYQ